MTKGSNYNRRTYHSQTIDVLRCHYSSKTPNFSILNSIHLICVVPANPKFAVAPVEDSDII
ncbi:hypothetical protein Syun_003746 [Stephania yunnanensis]|uniref:Uncharacterized protein n=1 Tax=Stephania yunnanensis TaxID=152371 RepID=A0AAP0L4B4_9MAGN